MDREEKRVRSVAVLTQQGTTFLGRLAIHDPATHGFKVKVVGRESVIRFLSQIGKLSKVVPVVGLSLPVVHNSVE